MVYMLWRMEMPRITYIIASTMRTGSYLLCEGLEYTGRAGRPREIFCPERRSDYTGRWSVPDDISFEEYVREAIVQGSTENGVFGTKIHWHHVEPLALQAGILDEPTQVLTELFPGAKYIRLRRRDRLAQAISWYRAEITNQWWLIPGVADWDLTGREPKFDAAAIRAKEAELAQHEKGWDNFFGANAVERIEMDYEALAADYRGEVGRALAFIGEDAGLAKELPTPRMTKQADALSEEWKRRMG